MAKTKAHSNTTATTTAPTMADVPQSDAGHQATIDQLNGQLATIRGLPQYADLERELTERIAALTAAPEKA